jgi:SAM-dependent methyltransferase
MQELQDGLDLAKPGIEFGPLDRPLLSQKRADVLYVDHASKEDLLAKYRDHPAENISPALVRNVDIVWPCGPLASRVGGRRFDYALASHVIEHVPDMIGWLQEVSSVLRPGGVLNLAIPFRDGTFDRKRHTTPIASLIANHIEKRTRPTAAQIFDHIAFVAPLGVEEEPHVHAALLTARKVEQSNEYLDVHCNVFTPESFLRNIQLLQDVGLTSFSVRKLFPPDAPGAYEFIVSLEKTTAT